MQTAEIICNERSCAFTISPAFREIDFGSLQAKPWSDFPDLYSKWSLHSEDIPYPGGENGSQVWQRCKTQLDALVAQQLQKAAIVCHGGTIRSIICGVLGIPQQKRFYLGLPLDNCSITIIKYSEIDGMYYLHSFNDCT